MGPQKTIEEKRVKRKGGERKEPRPRCGAKDTQGGLQPRLRKGEKTRDKEELEVNIKYSEAGEGEGEDKSKTSRGAYARGVGDTKATNKSQKMNKNERAQGR